jgi:thiol-disulfide isomerase/thioredoxin
MDRQHGRLIGGLAAWIAAAILWPAVGTAAPGKKIALGHVVADAALDGLNGPSHRLAEFRGRPLVINLWASWCGPCRAESASLERLAWREEANHFRIIGISTDDLRGDAKQWLAQSNATISHFLDHDAYWEARLGADHIPLTVLIDADGRIIERVYGARAWDSAEEVARLQQAFRWDKPTEERR